MARSHTFDVKAHKDASSVGFAVTVPTTIEEMDLIIDRWGSVERMIVCAVAHSTVNVATGIRKRLKAGDEDGAKAYASSYCDDAKKDGYVAPTMSEEKVASLDFTADQLAALRAAGMRL